MDCNIEKAQELLKSGKATKEELEKVISKELHLGIEVTIDE